MSDKLNVKIEFYLFVAKALALFFQKLKSESSETSTMTNIFCKTEYFRSYSGK